MLYEVITAGRERERGLRQLAQDEVDERLPGGRLEVRVKAIRPATGAGA